MVLPLASGSKVAVIGDFARLLRLQGAGSSQVNPARVASPQDALVAHLGADHVSYARGCDSEGVTSDALITEALTVAASADVVVVFAGLPGSDESEGIDRRHIDSPPGRTQSDPRGVGGRRC